MRGNGMTTDIVARAINRLDTMAHGEILALKVDAGEAIDSDLRAWCEATGNHLVRVDDFGESRTYHIEKGVPLSVVHRLALVLSTDDHDHLAAPLSLALAAALEGVEVSIFFEGEAVSILTAGYVRDGGRRWMRRSRRVARTEAHDQVRRIHDLGGDLYACARAAADRSLTRSAFAFDRVIQAEYLTFLPVMEEADIQLLA
jgi:predicted peroxiredoxin/TusA-related sulfurtransferase